MRRPPLHQSPDVPYHECQEAFRLFVAGSVRLQTGLDQSRLEHRTITHSPEEQLTDPTSLIFVPNKRRGTVGKEQIYVVPSFVTVESPVLTYYLVKGLSLLGNSVVTCWGDCIRLHLPVINVQLEI